jgi:hypothetical protein
LIQRVKLVTINKKNTMSTIIQLSKPVSRDAVIAAPAKDFSQAYIMHLNVNAEDAGPNDSINIVYCPFDKESGERLLTEQREISVPFWQIMEDVPEAAAAFKAVCEALPVLIAKQEQEHEKMIAENQKILAEQLLAEELHAAELLAMEISVEDDTAP